MSELKVPTVVVDAEVSCADGRSFVGRVFIPAASPLHGGPTRPEEWMNDPTPFFPFLPKDGDGPVLLNKREVLILSFAASAGREEEAPEEALGPERRVTLEAEDRRLEGTLVIDMPTSHMRVLDYLNRGGAFLTLRDGERHHLVQKERITRVIEIREE